MPKRQSVWDYLAWIVLFLILLWIILKITGKINTPILVEYSPLFGVVYLAGWAMSKLDRATKDIEKVKEDLDILGDETKNIETDIHTLRRECPKLKVS